MKILLVSSYLPYPLIDGGKIRLYNLIKHLSINHEITLVCLMRPSQTESDISEVKKICSKVLTVNRPKVFSVQNILKSTFTLSPLLVTSHTNSNFKKIIKNELENSNYDLIHAETFYIMQNIPKTKLPILLVEHNIEYSVYEKYVNKFNIFLRPLFKPDLIKLKRSEKNSWGKARKLVAVSLHEQKILGSKAEIVANGVDLNKFNFKKKSDRDYKKVLFIGNFKWIQNKDSAVYIIKNVWPKIISLKSEKDDYKLWIVGKNIPDSIKDLKTDTIIFDENAPDETEKIFQDSDVLLSPIRVGGGTSYKILESMASGTPVITTRLGNEGIMAKNNEEIVITDNPEEMAAELIKLLSDKYIYEKISKNGRKFIEENYDWVKISEKLDKIYRSVGIK